MQWDMHPKWNSCLRLDEQGFWESPARRWASRQKPQTLLKPLVSVKCLICKGDWYHRHYHSFNKCLFSLFQHRAAQEAIIIKDEQLREAQVWVQRAQEMDALHSTTNHSLQAELRDRTEQFNQFWLGCQRQVASILSFALLNFFFSMLF